MEVDFLSPIAENIPDELKDTPQWVCWKAVQRDGKWTKVPKNPQTGKNASSTRPETWASFDDAFQHTFPQQLSILFHPIFQDPLFYWIAHVLSIEVLELPSELESQTL